MKLLLQSESCSIGMAITHASINAIIAVFENIAVQESWQPGNQLHAHSSRSIYFTLHVDGALAGGLQLIPGAPDCCPVLTVWPEVRIDPGISMAHIAVLALLPEHRGKARLFWLLCMEMWRYCHQNGIRQIWIEATPRTLRCYQRLGWPLQIMGPLREHWGENCYPCVMEMDAIACSMKAKAKRSPLYRQLVELALRPPEANL